MIENKKDILIIKGINQYGVLSHMLETIGKELELRGYRVCICEWDEIEQYKDKEWSLCLSCQAIDMIFEVKADLYVTWLVDHPILLSERILKQKGRSNFWIGCVDQTHVEFLKTCMGFPHVFYLPHCAGQSNSVKKYADREIEVFFPASYLDVNVFEEEHSTWRTGAIKIISDKVIERLKVHNEETVEQAVKTVLEQMGEQVDAVFLEECMQGFGDYVDTYICRFYRQKIIEGLLEEGISITVAGASWNELKQKHTGTGKLNILSENMNYEDVLNCMANSKMVLNVFPGFKDGSHERVASALMNSAVCLTDQNRYTQRFLKANESAVLYDRNNIRQLAEKIRYYLEHGEKAEHIAENGRNTALQHMSVKNTVDLLLKGVCLN